jgi:hypothetical protein
MKQALYLLFLAAPALTLFGCGGKYKDASEGSAVEWAGQRVFLQGAPGALELGSAGIQGTGRVLMEAALSEAESAVSVALDFSLGNGSELTLVSHGDSNLQRGFELRFRREGAGAGSLKVSLVANGNEKGTVNVAGVDLFGTFDAANTIRLQIDIHNNEPNEAHVLVWDRSTSQSNFTEDNAIFNTGDAVDKSEGSPGKGSGIRMGVRLSNSLLRAITVGPAKFEH